MSDDIVSRAKALAYRAHEGQVDKAGRPYIEHVARVAASTVEAGCDSSYCYRGYCYFYETPVRCYACEAAETVAWLHDVAEDVPAFRGEISKFPHIVKMSVIRLTRTSTCAAKYYRIIKTDPLSLRVKLADIADNSDEERLALLDSKTANRLRKKYKKAMEALS